jgi:hypothetical protein
MLSLHPTLFPPSNSFSNPGSILAHKPNSQAAPQTIYNPKTWQDHEMSDLITNPIFRNDELFPTTMATHLPDTNFKIK